MLTLVDRAATVLYMTSTTTPRTDVDWLTPGADAVIITAHNHAPRYITRVKIKTVAAQSFSVENVKSSTVDRWRLGSRQGGRFVRSLGTWNGNAYLVPADDPEVAQIIRETRARRDLQAARMAFAIWEKDPADSHAADTACTAIATALAAAQTVKGA